MFQPNHFLQESSHLIVKPGICAAVPSEAKARVLCGQLAARLKRLRKNNEMQIPRSSSPPKAQLRTARNDNSKGLRGAAEAASFQSQAEFRLFPQPVKSCPPQRGFKSAILVIAGLLAGSGSLAQQGPPGSSSSKATKPEQRVAKTPAKGLEDASTIYRNPGFGFSYRVPYGWVERTKEMQAEVGGAEGEAQAG